MLLASDVQVTPEGLLGTFRSSKSRSGSKPALEYQSRLLTACCPLNAWRVYSK